MKKIVAATILAVIASSGAWASVPPNGATRDPLVLSDSEAGGQQDMAAALQLTAEQELEINSLAKAENLAAMPLIDLMREKTNRLLQAAEKSPLEEESVLANAAAIANLEAELIVLRVRTQARILAVLTPDQRRTLKDLNRRGNASSLSMRSGR